MTLTARTIRNYHAGDSLVIRVTAKEPDGSVIDLTGGDLKYGLSASDRSVPEFTKDDDTGAGGIRVIDVSKGLFEILIYPSDTEELVGEYYHEVEYTDSAGNVTTLFSGYINIKPSII